MTTPRPIRHLPGTNPTTRPVSRQAPAPQGRPVSQVPPPVAPATQPPRLAPPTMSVPKPQVRTTFGHDKPPSPISRHDLASPQPASPPTPEPAVASGFSSLLNQLRGSSRSQRQAIVLAEILGPPISARRDPQRQLWSS